MSGKPTYEELEQRIQKLEKAESERNVAEKTLQETNQLLECVLNGVPDIIGIQNPDHSIVRYNKAGYEALDMTQDEVVGRTCFSLIGRTVECEECATSLALKSKKLETVERFVPELGRYFLCRSNPVLDDNGEIRLIVEQLHDVTERKRAEEALRESEKKYRGLIEGLNDTIYRMTLPDGKYEYFSSSVEEVFGYTSDEFINNPLFIESIIHPDFAGYFKKRWRELLEGNVQEIYEYKIVDSEGNERWILQSNKAIFDDSGRIKAIEGLCRNITERKKAVEDLRESLQRLEFALQGGKLGMWDWNPQDDAVVYSDLWAQMLEYRPDEVEPTVEFFKQHVHPEELAAVLDRLTGHVEGRLPVYESEHRFRTKSGRWLWVLDRGKIAERDKDGRPVRVTGIIADITDRKRAEEALRESEGRFQKMLGVVPDMISIHSPEMDILYSNWQGFAAVPAAKQIPKTKCYKTYRGLDKICPDCQAGAVLESRKPIQKEVLLPDGTWVDLRAIPFLDEANNVEMFMEWVRDITERKSAEEEGEKLHAQLYQAQKMEAIGSLAGGVAHDLNNLLSPILGYGEILRDDLDPEDARRESVDEIISAGMRARDLVRQLLAFSRKQILEFKPLNLNKVTAGLERLLRYTIREDIEMEFDLTPDVGVVMADFGQIEQVIMNLSVNAADAMDEGGELTIETQKVYLDEEYANHHTSVKPGEYVMLAVSDSGVGMDEATRERIFDPFFSTKGESGTGLGLSTVYGIVKQHGGNIWVYSEPGKGSTFKVYLPVVEMLEPEEMASAEKINDLKGSETILIVEDSDPVRRLAESVLRRNGYQVLTAKDGAQALEAMASHARPVNLLLTDVVLPGMNGRELYEKATEASPSMKVLFMSGYTDNVIAHRGVLDEGVQFIQKPFTVYGLAVKVREVLDEK